MDSMVRSYFRQAHGRFRALGKELLDFEIVEDAPDTDAIVEAFRDVQEVARVLEVTCKRLADSKGLDVFEFARTIRTALDYGEVEASCIPGDRRPGRVPAKPSGHDGRTQLRHRPTGDAVAGSRRRLRETVPRPAYRRGPGRDRGGVPQPSAGA